MSGKKGFLRNTAVMVIAMFISKALGAVLKIPLGNILGGEGMGYFTTAYSIFTPVLSFACAGIPTILTRTVAGYAANGEYGKISLIRRCSLLTAFITGLAGTVLIYICAFPFVCMVANCPESLPGVLIIAPAVIFCSVTAVYRGYYEGLSDTLPTAVSQVIESFVKAGLGVGLSYFVYANGTRLFGSQAAALPYSAAAAVLGVTISELCGTVYMMIRSGRRKDNFPNLGKKPDGKVLFDVCKDIFMNSLPISLGAAASNLLSLADMLTVSNCIDLSMNIFPEVWASDPALSEVMNSCSGAGNFMYGCYAGIVMSVYMLTAAVSGVVARCALPRMTYAVETGNRVIINREIKLLIKGTAVMTAPVTLFMAVVGEPVLRILYPSRLTEVQVSAAPLAILGAGGTAAALLGAVCTVFHAYGDFGSPIKITLIGGTLKLLFNVMFILMPYLNVAGAAVSAVLSNTICLFAAVIAAKKRFGISLGCVRYTVPSVLAAISGSLCLYLFYSGLEGTFGAPAATAVSIILGGIVYALVLFVFDSADCTAVIRNLRRSYKRA